MSANIEVETGYGKAVDISDLFGGQEVVIAPEPIDNIVPIVMSYEDVDFLGLQTQMLQMSYLTSTFHNESACGLHGGNFGISSGPELFNGLWPTAQVGIDISHTHHDHHEGEDECTCNHKGTCETLQKAPL
jgi:hypothetical protein